MSYTNIESLMQRGMLDDAIVECQAVLQVTPNSPTVHAYQGICFFRKQEWEAAAKELRLAVILEPKFVEAGAKLAQALDKLGRHLEAYDVAEDMLQVQPNHRVLAGLRDQLSHHLDKRRIDNWERTVRMDTHFIDHF